VAETAVWAVVVHFGDPVLTRRSLERLAASTLPVSVVVVDNDGGLAAPTGVDLIRTGANRGFAGGANVGARYALARGASHVWFLNNDATPDPETLERLLETAEGCQPTCLVGSLEVDPRDADPQNRWTNRAPMLPPVLRGRVRAVRGRLTAVDFLSGFSMLISRPAFEQVGFFDESFFHYFEDVDFCLRAVLAGADVVLDCGAATRHRRATTLGPGSELETYYFFRNRLLLAARYRGVSPIVALLVADPRHGVLPLFSRRRLARRDWPWLRGAWRGTLDAVRGRTGPLGRPAG
jgi:N-acetylglucosaminyl-diphospho-decaprenol L-rhamnosyltransferase